MFLKSKLVHGDLSEFNILYWNGNQYIIDVSQAVSIYHPSALSYLKRDIKNILLFYAKHVSNEKLPDIDEYFKDLITQAEI